MNWLDIIQDNKVKKACEELRRELSKEEDSEKIEVLSKLYFGF